MLRDDTLMREWLKGWRGGQKKHCNRKEQVQLLHYKEIYQT